MEGDDDTARAAGAGHGPDEGIPPGVEQFQHAALEAVRAARAMLDAAETAIRDPAALEAVIRTAAGMARTATETVAGVAAAALRDVDPAGRSEAEQDPDDPDGGYHDISVG